MDRPLRRHAGGRYYVPSSEVQAYVKRAIANKLTDQQIRQVDIGKANVGIAVVYRGKIDNPNAVVAEHDLVSEVYHVLDGSATLVLGPDLVRAAGERMCWRRGRRALAAGQGCAATATSTWI